MVIRWYTGALLISCLTLMSASGPADKPEAPQRTPLLDNKISMVMPAGFVKMSEEILTSHYPYPDQRPQEVWYSDTEHGRAAFTFTMMNNILADPHVLPFAGQMKQKMRVFYPAVSSLTVNGRQMSRLEFKTPGVNGWMINTLQFSSRNGQLLLTAFNIPEHLQEQYEHLGKNALATLDY